jgi:23S rRNA (uracil1939-C5)-methyltransferase
MKKHINDEFMHFIQTTYEFKNQLFKKQHDKIIYMKEQGDNLDVGMILSNNISKCIEFCNTYNIEVNEIYDTYKIIKYDDVVKTYFPKKPNVNLQNIKLSIDSIYSITKPFVANNICKLIKERFKDVTTIIDGNSNVGTTTIAFAEYFKNVYSIEYDKSTFEKLNHNLEEYKLKNVETFLDDITLYMSDKQKLNKIDFDINKYCLFLDPPWTGVFYKLEQELDLYLSGINILDFIKNINIKYVAIKVPFNFNFKLLYKIFYNVAIYRMSGMFLVLIMK